MVPGKSLEGRIKSVDRRDGGAQRKQPAEVKEELDLKQQVVRLGKTSRVKVNGRAEEGGGRIEVLERLPIPKVWSSSCLVLNELMHTFL